MARPQPVPYRVKNLRKYRGDATKVVARSSWEKILFNWLDNHPYVVEWSSEETVIPYQVCLNEEQGYTSHRYFVDCKVTFHVNGKSKTYLVEVKPFAETIAPVPSQGKSAKTLLEQIATFKKNEAKWEAARNFCQERGWEFVIMTEYELGIKKA